ncbi:uncharacterized protein [Procambarus clarkii]|uniref:uncharacterized protein isoform X1 n=1 Tax=Procambarus clarkii TaxID=6728 RepID=UPI001E672790|nr:uncharacterized protein LOC123774052 isoform X1 [Procambarus clarkii]
MLYPGTLTTTMTPTQWLAVPTEIRLTEIPNLSSSQSDASEASTLYLNGKKIVIKQEDTPPAGCDEASTASVYLYPLMEQPAQSMDESVSQKWESIEDVCKLKEDAELEKPQKEADFEGFCNEQSTLACLRAVMKQLNKKQEAANKTQDAAGNKQGAELLTAPENVERLGSPVPPEEKCPSLTSLAPPEVIIVRSKPKNPDYKVKNNILATKRSKPVHFKILRGKPGMKVYISMSYQGHIYGDEPVKRCKKHDECSWCKDHEYNQSFCVISKFHKYQLDPKGKPIAVISILQEHLDKEGNVEFSLVFSCWNSCDIHSKYGKEMSLQLQLYDGKIRKTEYQIHCCQNLLRDAFKDKTRDRFTTPGIKRKQVSVPESYCECSKTSCRTGVESQLTAVHYENKIEKPLDLVVEGLDAERRDIIERMVKIMGGTSFPIPHLAKLSEPCDPNTEDEDNSINK